jgi:hypothetical protein
LADYSVFISAKSEDYEYAHQVYDFLVSQGVAAFFSPKSLPELGSSDFANAIDRVLDQVDHMIVVASSAEHVNEPWVTFEWRFFATEKRSKRKTGNLITIAVGGLKAEHLPPSLRGLEVIPFAPEAFGTVLLYVSPSQAEPSTHVSPIRTPTPLPKHDLPAVEKAVRGGFSPVASAKTQPATQSTGASSPGRVAPTAPAKTQLTEEKAGAPSPSPIAPLLETLSAILVLKAGAPSPSSIAPVASANTQPTVPPESEITTAGREGVSSELVTGQPKISQDQWNVRLDEYLREHREVAPGSTQTPTIVSDPGPAKPAWVGLRADRASQRNLKYQRALAEWKSLPWLERIRTLKPEQPKGI